MCVVCLCFSGKELHLVLPGFLRNLTDAVSLHLFITCQIMQNTLACKIRASIVSKMLCAFFQCSGSWGKSYGRYLGYIHYLLGWFLSAVWHTEHCLLALIRTCCGGQCLPSAPVSALFILRGRPPSNLIPCFKHKAWQFPIYNIFTIKNHIQKDILKY